MVSQETQIEVIKEQMKMNTQEHQEIKKMICDLRADLKAWVKEADKKFASKLTEKIVYGMIGAIVLSVLYYILKQVGIR